MCPVFLSRSDDSHSGCLPHRRLDSQYERLRRKVDGCVRDLWAKVHIRSELTGLLATGVYDEDFDDDPDEMEARFDKSHSATAYIGYHARKQLAFDLWWLALAVWLICIVERNRIGSPNWP